MEKNTDSCQETTRRGPSSSSSRETWTQTMRAVTVKVAVPMTIGRVERERWYARGACARDERDGRGIYICRASSRTSRASREGS